MKNSRIAWCDHTFNPWWGCTRVSPGCRNCYAEALSKRTGHDVWGQEAPRRMLSDAHWRQPLAWEAEAAQAGRPALVFCASMADVFEDRPDLVSERGRLFALIQATPHLRWLLLTKRPENVPRLVPASWLGLEVSEPTAKSPEGLVQIDPTHRVPRRYISAREWSAAAARPEAAQAWPHNAWVGTTVEDQQRAEERIPALLEVPAPVRFLSCEPLLGAVRLPPEALLPNAIVCGRQQHPDPEVARRSEQALAQVLRATGAHIGWRGIDWIITGGESGPRHRPFDPHHARALRDQADAAGVPYFFKQHGGLHPGSGGHLLDGELRWAWPADAGDRSALLEAEAQET